jgi:hypothetical protein
MEILFIFEGERWVARIGDPVAGVPCIELFMNGDALQKTSAAMASQLPPLRINLKMMRSAVFGGPLAILLDRLLAVQPTTHKDDRR